MKGLIKIKEKIRQFAKGLNIEYTGFTENNGDSLIIFLFPYYTDSEEENSNISVYCRSLDYHIVIKEYLHRISEYIYDNFGIKTEAFVDVDPISEVDAAVKCGLGIKGKNHLLINEKYGSFIFIGILKADSFIQPDEISSSEGCLGCNKCIHLCPALKNNDFSICISEITQKKGKLSDAEEKLIVESGYAFGCDKCQTVCPMNKYVKTPVPEFYNNRIHKLNKNMFEKLSNKEFKKLYGDRAFAWRGKNVLIRNLTLLEEENNPQE